MTIKPVTVDTVYEAVKSFIATNSILKQVIEDEFCGEFETIVSVKHTPLNPTTSNLIWLYINNSDSPSYLISAVKKEQLVKIINDFIA